MENSATFKRLWSSTSVMTDDARSNWGGNISYIPYDSAGLYWKGTREAKRAKPTAAELPSNGTPSESVAIRFQQTRSSWRKTSVPKRERINGPFYTADDRLTRNSDILLGLVDVSAVMRTLNNKAISEITAGKTQLSVDLLELGKTRTMVADAFGALLTGIRDVRRGQPLSSFVRSLRKEGWKGAAGRRFLEYTYGWAPTVSGAYEAADVLGQSWASGKIYLGAVKTAARTSGVIDGYNKESQLDHATRVKGVLRYQFSVSNPKLLTLSRLGFTNPAMIAWELLPWSFVLDWPLGFGDYLEKLDWHLGLSNIEQQTSVYRRSVAGWIERHTPEYIQAGTGIFITSAAQRYAPSKVMTYTWRGIKHPFKSKNAATRLTVSLALLNQQRDRMLRAR